MKVIVLTGLVSVEKAQLSIELAQHATEHKQTAHIIDNIARQSVENASLSVNHVAGDILPTLDTHLTETHADVVILAVSEQTHPEKLFIALDQVREQLADTEIYALAMIDTRTCDCFPNVRQALELYADATIMLPYQLDEILSYVDID